MFNNLCDFIKDELKELDRKAASGGKLTMQEVQYADLLGHLKKSLVTVDAMEESGGGYNDAYPYYSHEYGARRGARRDSMGRYSSSIRGGYRDADGMIAELKRLREDAPDESVRRKFDGFIREIEDKI